MTSSKRTSNKPNKPKKEESARRDRVVGKMASVIHMRGRLSLTEIVRLKIRTSEDDLFALFPRIFQDKNSLDFVHGPAFPVRPSELFSKPAPHKPADPLTEVIWAICRCLQFGEDLRNFTHLREEYERSLLHNSKNKCSEILDAIEKQFGYSIWLLQNKLAAAQFFEGIEETRKLVRAYEEECKNNKLMPWIIRFIGKRIEATGLKGYLKSELMGIFQEGSNLYLESYLKAKIFELPNIATDDVPATLFYEAQSCVIDYYETLIFVLQAAAKGQAIPSKMIPTIEKPLAAIYKRTQDIRLIGIMMGLGIAPSSNIDYHEKRADLIEAYTKGEYSSMAANSEEYLRSTPEDMSIQVMRLKACLRSGIPLPDQQGVLKEALESLQQVLSASKNAYAAAYALITLSERFYGHSWIHYLMAQIRYELHGEQGVFPQQSLRDIFVMDSYVSPFSAVAANGKAKASILNDDHLKALFPYTRSVYDAVTTGQINLLLPISEIRKQKYLAMHHLAFGNPAKAVEHFQWLIENTTGCEYIRASGGAALALLKLGQIREAVDTTVSAYVVNQNVPTILPIEQVADALKEPVDWPDTISTPILFELHTLYCGGEKLTQLKYAFELFQVRHNIKEPSDFTQRLGEFQKPFVIAYLDSVWTPEVMRQTILYCGTKEIEEARIKVCRLLAELNPDHATDYLDEIKERVKQLEIAKGTTLIEQSKVYVEIEAIKKSLKTKLGDSYARYKSSSQSLSSKPKQLLYKKITDVVSDIADEKGVSVPLTLSNMHSVSTDIGSESDAQFEAIFSEVTNEFLRGDHGLNAYLSTRVRHGKLSNILRKSVADEGLVTSRVEGGASYIRNQYWKEKQDIASEHQAGWETVSDELDIFSSEFDSVIEYINDQLIQIKIIHEFKDRGENTNALFVYRSSNLERMFVQEQDRKIANMDDFVNYCVNILWEKTDINLSNVQRTLDGTIRERLMGHFDHLTNRLNQISVPGVNDIQNAIARAKTNTQNKLALVISWFKRSEVYDRQDYAADFPFYIALNMAKNTISNTTSWNGASATLRQTASMMLGRTLDGMVDVFYVLIENAVLRSGLAVDDLVVNAEIAYSDGVFNAKISNNLGSTIATQDEQNKIEKHRESLRGEESRRRAQGEGRSGLHKVWLTINSPIYKNPELNFYHSAESFFVVEISFRLERPESEHSIN